MYVPLSSMHFDASESISDRIRRFTSKDEAEFKLGDRYELVLKNVDGNKFQPTVSVMSQKPEFRYLYLYDKIPCTSTLVPLEFRKKLKKIGNDQIFLQTRPCFEECTGAEELNRIVNKSQDLGDMRTLDYLPGGEFVFGNVLPRLLPPVVRRVQLVLSDDPQVLSCQKLIDLEAGVHWYSLRLGPIQHTNVHELFQGRAYFDEETNLVFRKFTMEDDDEYLFLITKKENNFPRREVFFVKSEFLKPETRTK
uniref:FTH domain-containing protein n=1 Tax=Caenorhabditis tropicalis TaxID=1561998 RepID=A0A1I7T2A3_9PELO